MTKKKKLPKMHAATLRARVKKKPLPPEARAYYDALDTITSAVPADGSWNITTQRKRKFVIYKFCFVHHQVMTLVEANSELFKLDPVVMRKLQEMQ